MTPGDLVEWAFAVTLAVLCGGVVTVSVISVVAVARALCGDP